MPKDNGNRQSGIAASQDLGLCVTMCRIRVCVKLRLALRPRLRNCGTEAGNASSISLAHTQSTAWHANVVWLRPQSDRAHCCCCHCMHVCVCVFGVVDKIAKAVCVAQNSPQHTHSRSRLRCPCECEQRRMPALGSTSGRSLTTSAQTRARSRSAPCPAPSRNVKWSSYGGRCSAVVSLARRERLLHTQIHRGD